MPLLEPERERSQQVTLIVVAMGVLLAVAALGAAGALAYSAYGERGTAGRFLAAPRCAGSASPSGDCTAWLTRRVSNTDNSKSGSEVDLDGGFNLSYEWPSGWVTGLTAGEPVPVLVWQGSAQALRDPGGHVLYAENSALLQGFNDISGAVALPGGALLMAALVFGISPWFQRRARHVVLAAVLTDAGLSVAAAGIAIHRADSVETGVLIGVIAFCVIAGLASFVAWLFRRKLVLAAGTR